MRFLRTVGLIFFVLGLKEVEKNVEKVVMELGGDVLPSREVSNGGSGGSESFQIKCLYLNCQGL